MTCVAGLSRTLAHPRRGLNLGRAAVNRPATHVMQVKKRASLHGPRALKATENRSLAVVSNSQHLMLILARSVLRQARLVPVAMTLVLTGDMYAQTIVRPSQPEAQATKAVGSGAITGQVVDATTGRPVGGALVVLEDRPPGSPRARQSFAQVTTPAGRFAFRELLPSEGYLLTATKDGYLDGGYQRSDPRGPSAPLSLNGDQWLRDVRVTMSPPGAISGTVVDERGEPIVGAHVRVLPQVLISGRTQWLAGAVSRTDDRGFYRIAGLSPGKYLVSVPSVQATLPASATIRPPGAMAGTSMADLKAAGDAARAERLVVDVGGGQQLVVGRYTAPPAPTLDGQRMAYGIAFYPNVGRPSDAAPIDLRVGESRSSVDFQLQPTRTARVSGVVQGPQEAVGNRLLRLIPVGLEELGQGSEAATTVTLADGRFTFVDVPIGSYVLDVKQTLLEITYTSMVNVATALPAPVPFPTVRASSFGVRAAPPGVEFSSLSGPQSMSHSGQLRVDVSDRNLDDVVLLLRRPVTLSGRIVWTPGSKPSSALSVLEPAAGGRSLGALVSSPKPGTDMFTFDGLMAGEYLLRTLGGTAVESIIWEGRDYTERPFDASDGRDITGVVMTLSNASSSVSGVVSDGTSTLTAGAAVIAFPIEPERWSNYGFNPPRIKSALTTSDGRYQLDGLPTGQYYLLAVPAQLERAWLDPAFLAKHASRANRIRVDRSDATIANVSLSLIK